jgi:hypothetical protein
VCAGPGNSGETEEKQGEVSANHDCASVVIIEVIRLMPGPHNDRDNRVAGVDCPFQSRPVPRLRFIALLCHDYPPSFTGVHCTPD